MPGKNHIKTTNGWPIKKLFWPFCFITQNQRLKNIVRDHLDEVYIVPYFVSKCFFCWLGHFKVSFYYPHPIDRAGGSILLVHYSMIILKPAIFEPMAVVRYDHTPIYNSPSHV